MTTDTELIEKFRETDTSEFPDFNSYKKTLERGLWILWAAKDKLNIKQLSAVQIASIIIDVKEISIDAKSITASFNRAADKIHTYFRDNEFYFEIMKPGKDHLISLQKEGSINVIYFEPDKPYTSKKLLSKGVLRNLKGELKIVDPYCGVRALDLLKDLENRVKFLTRIANLRQNDRTRFLRDLGDFKSENSNMEFKDYPHKDIHDRYIISSETLVILGHSIKDLGAKESLAIVLNKETSKNIVEALIENFNRRWKQSTTL